MNQLPHLADLALNKPLLLSPEKADVLLSVLSGRIGIEPLKEVSEQDIPNIQANRFNAVPAIGADGSYLGYDMHGQTALINGVATEGLPPQVEGSMSFLGGVVVAFIFCW